MILVMNPVDVSLKHKVISHMVLLMELVEIALHVAYCNMRTGESLCICMQVLAMNKNTDEIDCKEKNQYAE